MPASRCASAMSGPGSSPPSARGPTPDGSADGSWATPCSAAGPAAGAVAGTSTCAPSGTSWRSEEHTSELQSRGHLVCRLLLEKKNRLNLFIMIYLLSVIV